jgi:hypothetical protein
MVYGLLRALPGDRAVLPPSLAQIILRKLDASVGASGPHDFAVRSSPARLAILPRPPHPAPNVRDDREAPLLIEAGWRGVLEMICPTAQAKYFCKGGLDDPNHVDPPQQNSFLVNSDPGPGSSQGGRS